MRKDLEVYMDNREKRIAFAFMALDAKQDRINKLRERIKLKNKNPLFFYFLIFVFVCSFIYFIF